MGFKSEIDQVTSDITRLRYLFVNVYLVGTEREWALVDAALPGSADDIVEAAEETFGPGAVPSAIILTHGHFDHRGALDDLLKRWDVPVYAHPAELPFLTGKQDYPEPDPTVGKGAMALLSFAYPSRAIDLGDRVQALPDDGSIPGMQGWRWLPAPGHTAGQVALFRDSDHVLIAADAFVTTQQESLYESFSRSRACMARPHTSPRIGLPPK